MGLSSEVVLALAKKYTDVSVEGGGAVKGKNCTISDISAITGGNRVTFAWELDDGTEETGTMDVMDGVNAGDTGTFVTPEMYGAVGDGETDDTAAFTAAFAACNHVVCTPGKTYYFDGTVDVSDRVYGELNINRATLSNFHMKVGMANAYEPSIAIPSQKFVIRNGEIGIAAEIGDDWETPAIIGGAQFVIHDVRLVNTPYLLAITNSYRDYLEFKNIHLSWNDRLWDNLSLDLDAVSMIRTDGTFARFNKYDIEHVPSGSGGIHGDGWVVDGIFEFRDRLNSGYAFVHFYAQSPVIVSRCIQSKFYIGYQSKVLFDGCHFELANTLPEFLTLTDSSGTPFSQGTYPIMQTEFRGCYFWNKYVLEVDKPYVTYTDCFFRVGETTPTSEAEFFQFPLASTLNNVDLYNVKCKVNSCMFGRYVLDSEELKLWRRLPKITRSWKNNNTTYEKLLADTISATKTIGSGSYYYPATGTYSYKGFTFANSAGIAHESYEWTRTVSSNNSAYDWSGNISGLTGGWGFEIYRTLPGGTIQRCRYYDAPMLESGENFIFQFAECGNWAQIKKQSIISNVTVESMVILPWITVSSIPSYAVNNKAYEKNGVLVTPDNSKITDLGANSTYVQVPDVYTV